MGARDSKKPKKGRKKSPGKQRAPYLWERQPDESLSSFEAFVIYRDMPERSTRGVAAVLGKAPTTIDEMLHANNWKERVVAWDNEIDRRIRKVELDEARKMAARQIQLSFGLQEAATLELQALVQRIKFVDARAKADGRTRQPLTSVKDIVRLVEAGTKLERINRGEPDSIEQHKISGDGTTAAIEKIIVKMVDPSSND